MPKVVQGENELSFREFGEHVRAQRRRRKWTIEALAQRAGISARTLVRVEQGYPSSFEVRERISIQGLGGIFPTLSKEARKDQGIHHLSDDWWVPIVDIRTRHPENAEELHQI